MGKRDHTTIASSSDQDVPQTKRSARRAAPPTSLGGVQDDSKQEIDIHEPVVEAQLENDNHDEVDDENNQHDNSEKELQENYPGHDYQDPNAMFVRALNSKMPATFMTKNDITKLNELFGKSQS